MNICRTFIFLTICLIGVAAITGSGSAPVNQNTPVNQNAPQTPKLRAVDISMANEMPLEAAIRYLNNRVKELQKIKGPCTDWL